MKPTRAKRNERCNSFWLLCLYFKHICILTVILCCRTKVPLRFISRVLLSSYWQNIVNICMKSMSSGMDCITLLCLYTTLHVWMFFRHPLLENRISKILTLCDFYSESATKSVIMTTWGKEKSRLLLIASGGWRMFSVVCVSFGSFCHQASWTGLPGHKASLDRVLPPPTTPNPARRISQELQSPSPPSHSRDMIEASGGWPSTEKYSCLRCNV